MTTSATPNHSSLALFLESNANKFSTQTAFSCLGVSISYAELELKSRKLAYWLQQLPGLNPGDRIAIQLPNCLEFPIAVYGVLRAGFVLVNTNPNYTPREMQHQFVDSGAKVIFLNENVCEKLGHIANSTDILHIINIEKNSSTNSTGAFKYILSEILSAIEDHCQIETPPLKDTDVALIQYTGGTTGVSKGACLSHKNILANIDQIDTRLACTTGTEIFVCPLPLYHIYAFTVNLMFGARLGAHITLISNPQDPIEFVESMQDKDFSVFTGINTLFVNLCKYQKFRELDFSHLRLTMSGGSTLTMDAAREWMELTNCSITEGYGLSETSPVVAFNIPGAEQLGTVGPALDDTQIAIRDPNNTDVLPGKEGEVLVKGPQVMQGYWNREKETSATFSADGFFKTGDIGKIEASGALRIVDRLKDMILVSGFNVYPNEVENVLTQHPSILETAVVGKPCEKTGEAVWAYITTNAVINPEEIKAFCRTELTSYKVPKHIVVLESLPKSSVGKILRKSLRQ